MSRTKLSIRQRHRIRRRASWLLAHPGPPKPNEQKMWLCMIHDPNLIVCYCLPGLTQRAALHESRAASAVVLKRRPARPWRQHPSGTSTPRRFLQFLCFRVLLLGQPFCVVSNAARAIRTVCPRVAFNVCISAICTPVSAPRVPESSWDTRIRSREYGFRFGRLNGRNKQMVRWHRLGLLVVGA